MSQSEEEIQILRGRSICTLLDTHHKICLRVAGDLRLPVEFERELNRIAFTEGFNLDLRILTRRLSAENGRRR